MAEPGRLAAELRAERIRRGWTQAQVATAMGTSETVVSTWERGTRHPTGGNLIGWAGALGSELLLRRRPAGRADLAAADLIADRTCSATCLLAAGIDDGCGCPCAGRWHGLLARTPVPGSGTVRRPHSVPQPGPHLLDELAAHSGATIATGGS